MKKMKEQRKNMVPLRNITTKISTGVKDTSRKKYSGLKHPLNFFGAGAGAGFNADLSRDEMIVVVMCMLCCVCTIVLFVFFGPWFFVLIGIFQFLLYMLIIVVVLLREPTILLVCVLFLIVLTGAQVILMVVALIIYSVYAEEKKKEGYYYYYYWGPRPSYGLAFGIALAVIITLLILQCLCNGILIFFGWRLSGGLR